MRLTRGRKQEEETKEAVKQELQNQENSLRKESYKSLASGVQQEVMWFRSR